MTTTIYIRNNATSQYNITLQRSPSGSTGTIIPDITPGSENVYHVWEGSSIVVSEGPFVMRTYRNPENLMGPVFIEEDGTIRHINLMKDI